MAHRHTYIYIHIINDVICPFFLFVLTGKMMKHGTEWGSEY